MNESMAQLPQPAEAWPDGLNRAAMQADAAAVLSLLDRSETWTLLDQTVTPLLGRSPRQIVSELSSAAIDLPDEVLEPLLWLVVDHLVRYAAFQSTPRWGQLAAEESSALVALRDALARVVGR